ncbi:MAG: exopolysaccharide biosynthesis protein [Alphaproteobacteria bacterium]|nr:exopolysaccharide biosynthesis protein [Alphaproteobacteria bacterium]
MAASADPQAAPDPHVAEGQHRRTSDLLLDFVVEWPGERVRLGDLIDALGERGFGMLMLVLALPNMVPLPMIGVSGVLGTPIIFLCLQMLIGLRKPWLPRIIRDRSIARADLERILRAAKPRLERLEHYVKPGGLVLTRPVEMLAALLLGINAVLLSLPIPFGNPAPAFAIVVMSLAIIEADRRWFWITVAIGIAAIIIDLVIISAVVGSILVVFGWARG